MRRIGADGFAKAFSGSIRWLDVRAPVEFQAGSIPGSRNLPLLTDEERHQVGIAYKNRGQEAAIELGHRLVRGDVRKERLRRWVDEIKGHPQVGIFCFRGGLRSQTVQSWLAEAGYEVPLLDGGYKAARRFFLEALESLAPRLEFQLVSGPTGSGKTEFIKTDGRPFLDLEGLAKHRGSAFGATEEPQPSQADFENALALELLRLAPVKGPILIEDESRLVGRRSIPPVLFLKMKESPRLLLNPPLEIRIENIFRDYILASRLGARNDPGQFDDFRRAVRAISNKLGGARAQELLGDLETSERDFREGRGLDSNRVWIRKLLEWYYDPAYQRVPKRP